MSQRRVVRSNAPVMIAAAVAVVLIAVGVYWFVIRDDKTGGSGSTPPATKTFTAPGDSFTFKYPAGFVVNPTMPAGYVWIAGVGTYDILTVKRLANQPTPPERLVRTIRATLKKQAGTSIDSQGTEQRAGIDMVTFVAHSVVGGKFLTSHLYYFSANNVTWQLECESQSQAAVIDSACAQALATFTG